MAGNRVNISRSSGGESFVRPTVERRLFVYPDCLRFKGSVIPSLIIPVTCLTLFAYSVALFDSYFNIQLALPSSIVPSLSVVVGLLLVFRTNTAYDRYYEGRRLWTVIKSSTRNLARAIYMVPGSSPEDIEDKRDALNLAAAFSFSTKFYLRDELEQRHHELDWLLTPTLCSQQFKVPNHLASSSTCNEVVLPKMARVRDYGTDSETTSLKPKIAPVYQSGYGSVSSLTASTIDVADEVFVVNLPLEIIYHINTYVFKQRQSGVIDPQTNNAMNSNLTSLVDSLGGLERIMRTPIPLAYLIHLKQAVTLYLMFLPFTLTDLDFMMVPLVSVVAFTLYGIDAIGQEIENPFGYDANDLPLDAFCKDLHEEIKSVIAKL